MVETLLLLRANINAKSFAGAVAGDGKGSSALRMAQKRGHDTVVTLLLAARADADVANSSNSFETGSASKGAATGVETNATCATTKCARRAAAGYEACCRTCVYHEGAKHGPKCQKAFEETEGGGEHGARTVASDEGSEQDSNEEKKEKNEKKRHPNFDKEIANELAEEVLARITKRLGAQIRAKDVSSFESLSGGNTFEAGAFTEISQLLVARAGAGEYFKFVKSEPYREGVLVTYVGKDSRATARMHGTTVEHMGEGTPTVRQPMLIWKGNSDNFYEEEWRVWGYDEEYWEKAWGYAIPVLRSNGIADCCMALVDLDEERVARKRKEQSKTDRDAGKKKSRQLCGISGEIVGLQHYVFPATELAKTPERKFYGEGSSIEDGVNEAS
jgi:hypothetical protein